jgi:tetratricopeptide (TPR) repeat protein
MVEEGKKLYEGQEYQGAVVKFEQAMKAGPGTQAGDNARKSLVVTYNRMGLNAFEAKDYRTAEGYWFKAHDLDPNDADVNNNLQKVYDRIGNGDQALQDWRNSLTGRVGETNPAAPGVDTRLQNRLDEAKQLYTAGEEAMKRGDTDAARADWQRVIELATGTPLAEQARTQMAHLNESSTSDSPFFRP